MIVTIGNCTLYQGNCMDVLTTLKQNSVDAVVTDIPYGEVSRDSNGLRNLDKGYADEVTVDIHAFLTQIDLVCKGSFYIFCGTRQLGETKAWFSEKGYTTRTIIWEKTNPSPMNGQFVWLSGIEFCSFAKKPKGVFNGNCRNTVLKYPAGTSRLHPTQKPISLICDLINTSTNEGDVVIDPCMGSGTTGIACIELGRKFIGIELNKNSFEIACQRIRGEWGRKEPQSLPW